MNLSIDIKRKLLYALSLVFIYCCYRYLISPRVIYSRYFSHDLDLLKKRIELSERTSIEALAEYKEKINEKVFNRDGPMELCVGIASISRPGLTYLEQTISSLLTRIPLKYQDRVRITLYNVEEPSDKHRVAAELSSLINVQNISYRDIDPEAGPFDKSNMKRKEFLDYLGIMKAEKQHQCKHYLILEDDVLAATNWAEQILTLLKENEESMDSFALLKLFSLPNFGPTRWDWHKPSDYFLLYGASIGLTCLVFLAVEWLLQPKKNHLRLLMIVTFFVAALSCSRIEGIIKAIKESRAYWTHVYRHDLKMLKMLSLLFPLLVVPATFVYEGAFKRETHFNVLGVSGTLMVMTAMVGCMGRIMFIREGSGLQECDLGAMTQAVIFSRNVLEQWDTFFTKVYFEEGAHLQPKDMYVPDFIKEYQQLTGQRMKPMILVPNLFQHIGISSSVGNDRTLSSALISYSFPDDDVPIQVDYNYLTN